MVNGWTLEPSEYKRQIREKHRGFYWLYMYIKTFPGMLNLKSLSEHKDVMGFCTKAINLWTNAGQRHRWMRIGNSGDITKWYMECSEASGQQGWFQACLASSLQPQLSVSGDPGHLPESCRKDVPPWRILISWCMTEKSGSNSLLAANSPSSDEAWNHSRHIWADSEMAQP